MSNANVVNVIIDGNLVNEPRTFGAEGNVGVIKIASNRRFTDDEGVTREVTEYNDIRGYRETAKTLATFHKGDHVAITGAVVGIRKWDNKGTAQFDTEIKLTPESTLVHTPKAVTTESGDSDSL
jgi:single-stranded DNA-binding protein